MKSTQHSSSTLLILLCKKRSHTLEAVSKRSSDPSHLPYHYPGLHQTSLETLFGLGAFTLLWYIAFLDTQKMLKPPSRPGQPVGPFQPLIARALGQQQETASVVAPPLTALYNTGSAWFDGHTARQHLLHAVPMGSLPCDGSAIIQLYSWPEMPLSHCRYIQCPVTR